MKKLLFILIALLQLKVALAQTFPVRVTPQAIPPYPTNLSGYANSGITNSPLRVQLVLSDVTASSREVRLAVAIEGNGINAISAPVVIGAPTLILDGGIPLNLTISELAPYFEQQNLQGISSVQYNSPLPDGSYRFCFEVFDAFTGNRLSSKNCATIFLINNDPPFLNKPDNQAKISEQNPTNIIFQWTPRHINVPNVSYEFSLVEVWDPYIDPQAIFVASPPLYQEVTTNTSLLYGPVQPLLLAGKRYAWRVRAFATNNGEEVSVFNNNGNSEIFWFDYQASCELPSNIQVQDVSMTNATISWIGHPDHLDYTIKYREAGSDRWYSKTTPRDYVTIDEFKADTVYEYRVVGNCTQNSFGESPVDTFRTLSEELADYASCGIQPDPVDLSNQELLTELFVNDVFTAGDFPVYVKEVSGSTSFTGEGYISTPWLATVRIPVKFENIKINTEMKLVDGFVVTTYDPNWGSIADADVIIDTITGDDGDTQVINVDMDIVDVQIDENGDITLIGADGTESDTFDGGNDIIFVDNTKEEWHINPDGTITKGEQAEGGPANSGNTDGVSGGGVNEITAAGITVTFNNTNGFYSFDTVPKNAGGSIANEYDKVPISGGGEYDISYKAIAALPNHLTDFVTAEVAISTNDYSASDIIFKTKEGTKVQASWNRDSTTATLSLKKAFDFAKQQIIATVRPKDSTDKYTVAGATNLWHLANQQVAGINVKLISVNGASLSGIGERINEIYNPAGIQFNVTSASPLTVSDTTLDVGDSSLLSQYTEGEKAWISQFKTLPGYQRDTYYLFVTDIPPSDSGTEGFMPLKRQFGFVFTGDDKGRTAAHELGHGVFGLEHPFKKYNTTGTTDLLMDYGTGVRLSHMDWEKMHAPGIQIYWFQGDEDGESSSETDPFAKVISVLAQTGNDAILKCKKCESEIQSENVDGKIFTFKNGSERYKCIIASITQQEYNFYSNTIYENATLNQDGVDIFNKIKNESNGDKDVLFLINSTLQFTKCSVKYPLSDNFCDETIEAIPDSIKNEIAEEIQSCYESILEGIGNTLKDLTNQVRNHQKVEFENNGIVYHLNDQSKVEIIENPLSNDQINSGDWSDINIDIRTRLTFNKDGILQYTALGIRNNLPIAEGKTANLTELSTHMLNKGNEYFLKYKANSALVSAKTQSINLDGTKNNDFDNEFIFPDGKKVEINEDASYWKILSESGSHLIQFAKTAEIEQIVYNNDAHIIKAPPIGTGSLEAVARSVTDITSTVVMVYDLAIDEEARKNVVSGFSQLKDQVKQNPSMLFPMLFDIALEEVTGNTGDNYAEIENLGLANPRSQHIVSKGTVRTSITVFTSASLLQKLPGISKRLILKILRLNFKKRLKNIGDISDNLIENLLQKIDNISDNIDVSIKFFDDFAESSDEILKAFVENTNLVEAWKKLDGLGINEAIRRNPLHLEVTKKLEDLKLRTNPIEADKLIKNINEGIDQIGDNGKIILTKIKSGGLESISGYKDLIQGIKKVPDNVKNSNVANEVAQTFRHLDNTSSVPSSRKVLGHKSTTDPKFDIDYGEKSTNGSQLYDKVYQFKTTDNASSVHNRLKSDDLKKQLLNTNSNEKILQIEIRKGSITDVETGKYFTQRLKWAKDNVSGFKLIITDINGSILKTY